MIVGIGDYRYAQPGQFPPLAFANADADGIERYVRTCWPASGQAAVARVNEEDATTSGVRTAFSRLTNAGPFDLLLIFLSGHGLVGAEHTGFLTQPENQQDTFNVIGPDVLDALLEGIQAKRTVMILDCCFAEGIMRKMRFFSGLSNDLARLYVASSRETQRTWEDVNAQHGVFTAHLLDLLNTGSSAKLGGIRDVLDVDGELFPVLCEQVPLYVYSAKNQIQEPVKGGVSSAPVVLPVARVARRLREQTVLGTAFRRVRQIATGVAALVAVFLLFSYSMLYYVEPNAGGTLTVRRGTRWLEPVFQFLPATRVDTGIRANLLSSNPAASRSLEGGYSTGVWTHLTAGGYRLWFETISAGLQPAAAAQYNILVGNPERRSVHLDVESRPDDVAFVAWAAMCDGRPEELDAAFEKLPVDTQVPLQSVFDPRKLDFNVLDLTVENMQAFARTLVFAATLDPIRTLPHYMAFAKSTQEWLAHNTDAQRGRDAREQVRDAVASVLSVIVRARQDRGLIGLDPASIALMKALSAHGYSEIFDTALSQIRGSSQSQSAAQNALNAFNGDPEEPAQGRALEEIRTSLDGSLASKAMTDAVYARFIRAGNQTNSYLTRFLIEAGDTKSLSPKLIDGLLQEARTSVRKPDRDFTDSELARVLSHAMTQVPVSQRSVIYQLIDLVAGDVTPQAGSTAEMYAALGKQRLDPPGMLAKVSTQAHKAPAYAPDDPAKANSPLPGMTIIVGYGPWVAALAQYGRTRALPEADIALLRSHLADPTLHNLIVPALVAQEPEKTGADRIESWIRELSQLPRNSEQRALRQSIITEQMAAIPWRAFQAALTRLRSARDRAIEPEFRIALSGIIADSQYGRVRGADKGLALFE